MPPRPPSAPASLVGGLTLLAIALLTAPAAADPETVRFAWVRARGADACASQQQIEGRVEARLGRSPFAAGAGRSVEVIVTHDPRGFHAEIYERGRDGDVAGMRALSSEAATCGPIEDASVLAIALAIDPEAGTRPPPPPHPTAPAPPPPPPPPTPEPRLPPPPAMAATTVHPQPVPLPAPAPVPDSRRDSGTGTGAGTGPNDTLGDSGVALRFGVGLGLLPQPAPGLDLAGQVAVASRVQVGGEALWLPEARTSDGHFGFGLTALALGACVTALRIRVADLSGCASFWAGALHAVVYDLTPATPGDWFWAAASLTPRFRLSLTPRLHAELGVHLIVPVTARPFDVMGWKSPAFQETPVTSLPFLGLGANFP